MKLTLNPDTEHVNKIKEQLKSNGNYCPCALEKSADTKCPCTDVRNMLKNNQTGMCHCGLYIVEDENAH